jgi:hypothetical protein
MQKSLKLAINAFNPVPATLQDSGNPGHAISEIMIELADLYHHYYLQSYDCAPPDPDPAHFEHIRHLMPCIPFRFQRHGLGAHKTKKQNNSNDLGEAFCRWFLDKHLDINHVARIDDVRDHGALLQYSGVSVESAPNAIGNAPDYFCVGIANAISLAEAKGSIDAVGFGTKLFQTWRQQFNQVRVLDAAGKPMRVKGYIVAMRWATEAHSPKIFTKLSAEDPETTGERPFADDSGGLAAAVKSLHYAPSLAKLRQPILSAALARGFTIPDELRFQVAIWQCFLPQLKGLRFVGGYFPRDGRNVLPYSMQGDKMVFMHHDPFRLDISSGTFFGIEENTFGRLVDTARVGPLTINQLPRLDRIGTGYSGASLLRDGHVLGPIELFSPVALNVL